MEAVLLYVHATLHAVPYTLDREADLRVLADKGCLPGSVKVTRLLFYNNNNNNNSARHFPSI